MQARVNNPRVARTVGGTAPRIGVSTTDDNHGAADLPLTTKADDTCQRGIRRDSAPVNPGSALALLPMRMIDNRGLSSLGNGTVALSRKPPLELHLKFAATRMSLFGLQYKRKIKTRKRARTCTILVSSVLHPLPPPLAVQWTSFLQWTARTWLSHRHISSPPQPYHIFSGSVLFSSVLLPLQCQSNYSLDSALC